MEKPGRVEINYGRIAHWQARGRHNFMKTSGIDVTCYGTDHGDEILLHPLTGKGAFSEAARLVVPVDHAEAFSEAILAVTGKSYSDEIQRLRDLLADALEVLDTMSCVDDENDPNRELVESIEQELGVRKPE